MEIQSLTSKISARDAAITAISITLAIPLLAATVAPQCAALAPLALVLPFFSMSFVEGAVTDEAGSAA